MKSISLLLISTSLIINCIQAQKPGVITKNKAGWQKIGEANSNFKIDKDKFVLIGKDRFKLLQVKAKDAPILIENMQVEYEGDIKEEFPEGCELKVGEESKKFKLKNSDKEIKNVTFIYRTMPNSGTTKAEIELWGFK